MILVGHPTDDSWRANLWTDAYLIQKAGDASVLVEKRASSKDDFGQGKRVPMAFGDFVRQLGTTDRLYLTSQALSLAADGYPLTHAPPVTQLLSDVPRVPSLMGHLVPQQHNMWMGAANDGTSSGLHHDFHDNLYVLLRGRKRFRLFSPDAVEHMYMHGRLHMVHENGRIVYEGEGAEDVRADGSEGREVRSYLRRVELEESVAAAERAVRKGEKGAAARLAEAEAQHDAFMEQALEAAAGAEDNGFDLRDDFDDADDAQDANGLRADSEDKVPDHFSRVNLYAAPEKIAQEFPAFPGVKSAAVAEVSAGEMLYLPAGWFHEVQSKGSAKDAPTHLAFNYWFHPPDNLTAGPDGFRKPYKTPFWSTIQRRRLASEARGAEASDDEAEVMPVPEEEPALEEQVPRPKKRKAEAAEDAVPRPAKERAAEQGDRKVRPEKRQKGERAGAAPTPGPAKKEGESDLNSPAETGTAVRKPKERKEKKPRPPKPERDPNAPAVRPAKTLKQKKAEKKAARLAAAQAQAPQAQAQLAAAATSKKSRNKFKQI